jgi:hypothetical protein
MAQTDPMDLLQRGSSLLAPILESHGFALVEATIVDGSGGSAAVGRWAKTDRSIETHVRGALGIVDYTWGTDRISHKDYLRALGLRGAYPGFSSDPIQSFQHLAEDLRGVAAPVLQLTRNQFGDLLRMVSDLPKPRLP